MAIDIKPLEVHKYLTDPSDQAELIHDAFLTKDDATIEAALAIVTKARTRPDLDNLSLVYAIAQLRHLYAHLVNGTFKDSKELADGLLAPQIRQLEALADKR